jgi:hypothetical protein
MALILRLGARIFRRNAILDLPGTAITYNGIAVTYNGNPVIYG